MATTTTTVGAFKDRSAAEEAIISLRDAGVSDSDISCLYTDTDGTMRDEQTGEKIGTGAAKGATVGAAVGAIAGLAVANGILPGLGTLFVAGPLAAALGFTGATAAGAATGLAAGGIIGALTNIGVDKEDAVYFQKMLNKGSYLVVVRSAMSAATDILRSHRSSEVREYQMA